MIPTYTPAEYAPDGTTTVFPIPWPYQATSHIKIYIDGAIVSSGVTISTPSTTGNATFSTAPTGTQMVIRRELPFDQTVDFQSQTSFSAVRHGNAYDRAAMQAADLNERLNRAVVAETGGDGAVLPAPEDGKYLGWDSGGNLTNLTGPSSVAVSSAMTPVVQAATTLLARAAMGAASIAALNVKDSPYNAVGNGVTDDTTAIQAAVDAASLAGGGIVLVPTGTFIASQIILKRTVVLLGMGIGATELKQKDGSNKDFLISENFATLTTTGAAAPANANVPYWFGAKCMRINGNKANQSSGRCIAWYGAAQIADELLVYDAYGDGIYTEYSSTTGSSAWQGQEEGMFGKIVCMRSGGKGWNFRGPHNSTIHEYHAGYSGSWGFYSETAGNYDGSIDSCGLMHTYGSGGDQGISLNGIARIANMIVDGDNLVIGASRVQIGVLRGYNIGGSLDGVTITSNDVKISNADLEMWASSTGRYALNISGDRIKIGIADIRGGNYDNDGVTISGAECDIRAHITGFGSAVYTRTGLTLTGTYNLFTGTINACRTMFAYTAGSHNRVNIEGNAPAYGATVTGSTPATNDNFYIRTGGTGAGSTAEKKQSSTFSVASTGTKTVTIAHGLLYTPALRQCNICLANNTAVDDWVATAKVSSVDATNVVVNVNVSTASATGGSTAYVLLTVSAGLQ